MKVLIADDSTDVQKRLVKLFSFLKNVTIRGQTQTVAETINLISSLHPDAVVLDIQMPGGSGIDVLQRFKNEATKPIFIVLTNHASQVFRKKCFAQGADYFFDKTTEFDLVLELLNRLSATNS